MPSQARLSLDVALADVDQLIKDHAVVTGGGVGAPKGKVGRELTRAGTVLLSAALEGYVEDAFDEVVDLLFADRSTAERKKFKKASSGRMNNPGWENTTLLFSRLGISPWALESVKWAKFSNGSVQKSVESLVKTRNKIAHGNAPASAQLPQLRRWKNFVERYANKLDKLLDEHVGQVTGTYPGW